MKKLLPLLLVFALVGCTKSTPTPVPPEAPQPEVETNPVATLTMTSGDVITIELYPEIAPNTVNNFISLANKGFYNGLSFHRIISGFMIQGGDPDGTGGGGPGYSIPGEFSSNGFENDLKHTEGVISMARTKAPESAGSQFFIMHETTPSLDGEYAAFGKVTSGLDIVDKIANLDIENIIKSITVDTFGVTYPEPTKTQ